MATVPNIGSISKPLNVCEALAWEGRRRKVGVEQGEKATQAQSVAISLRPLTPSLAAKRGAPAFIRTLFFGITAGRSNYSVTLTSAACVPACACLPVCVVRLNLKRCLTPLVLLASFDVFKSGKIPHFRHDKTIESGQNLNSTACTCRKLVVPVWRCAPSPRVSSCLRYQRTLADFLALGTASGLFQLSGLCVWSGKEDVLHFTYKAGEPFHFTSQLQLPATPYFSCSSFSCYPCAYVCVCTRTRAPFKSNLALSCSHIRGLYGRKTRMVSRCFLPGLLEGIAMHGSACAWACSTQRSLMWFTVSWSYIARAAEQVRGFNYAAGRRSNTAVLMEEEKKKTTEGDIRSNSFVLQY